MVQRTYSTFEAFEFTEEELKAASTFTDLQRLYLTTLRAQAAMQKIALPFDPSNPQVFVQNEAVLRGKIDVITLLLGD